MKNSVYPLISKQDVCSMLEFIDRAVKLEDEEGICIYEIVNEENLNDYLKDNDNEEIGFFDNKTSVCKNCGHLIRRKFDSYFLWQHFTHYMYNSEVEIMVDIMEAKKKNLLGLCLLNSSSKN
ncbi:MAG: hypothetical protein PQ971_05680 [Methanobacterium sp.]